MNDSQSRFLRTLAQLIAGGFLTELFLQLAKDVPHSYAPYIVILSTMLVTYCQLVVETKTDTRLFRATA